MIDTAYVQRMARYNRWQNANLYGVAETLNDEERRREREAFDDTMIGWADRLDPVWLVGDLTWYSGAAKRDVTKPKWQLVMHFFNHETHHRGQVHCMLTQAGAKPYATDLSLLPESP